MRRNIGLTVMCCVVGLMWLLAAFTDDSLLGGLMAVAGIIIWLGLIMFVLYKVAVMNSQQWREIVSQFLLLLIPLSAVTIILLQKGLSYKSDWLVVKAHDFTGSDEFRLKENGSFEYWRDSPLGSSVIVDGKYIRHDSTIVLQPNSTDKLGDLHGFIIRPFFNDDERIKEIPLKLIPLDGQGQKVDSFYFYANVRDR